MGRSKTERKQTMRYFATTSLGLEIVLEQELRELGARNVRRASSGVSFTGDRRFMMRACMELRTAHRVLWEIGVFHASTVDALYAKIRTGVAWSHLIPKERTFAVHANASGGAFHDSRFVSLRIKDAIVDRVRADTEGRPTVDVEAPDVRVVARVRGDTCQLSADASGRSLHHRFYRERAGKAPLRESLAAGLVLLSGWKGVRPLMDPMCGSGTIPIEAAHIKRNITPACLHQMFGFQRWMGYREPVFQRELDRLHATITAEEGEAPSIFGADHSGRILDAARANAELGKVEESISWTKRRVEELENPCPELGPGIIVSNPPYGERINETVELKSVFRKMGERLKTEFPGWECWFLLPDAEFVESFGLRRGKALPLKNGPLDVVATQFFVD
jgi:putative N6-adenine-specific DNA methylase